MATRKITQLEAIDAVNENDLLVVDDLDTGSTRKATVSEVLRTLHPSAPVWDDLRFPPSLVNPGPANAPDFVQVAGLGTVYVMAFNSSVTEDVHFVVQMPHSWKEGSTIKPHVHWTNHEGGTGDVRWVFEYTKAVVGGVFATTQQLAAVDTAEAQYTHQVIGLGDVDMTGDTVSTILLCRVSRDAGHAGDTLDQDAGLLEIDIHYQIDGNGSAEEFAK